MTASQRRKGKGGELELAGRIRGLSGWDVRRRVRQHDGDSDLEGIPGWSVEVKRHKAAGRAEIGQWWRQTVQQATGVATDQTIVATARISCRLPVLFYRLDRADWRAVWPVSALLTHQCAEMWVDYAWTCESSVEAWAAVARDVLQAPGTIAARHNAEVSGAGTASAGLPGYAPGGGDEK